MTNPQVYENRACVGRGVISIGMACSLLSYSVEVAWDKTRRSGLHPHYLDVWTLLEELEHPMYLA